MIGNEMENVIGVLTATAEAEVIRGPGNGGDGVDLEDSETYESDEGYEPFTPLNKDYTTNNGKDSL